MDMDMFNVRDGCTATTQRSMKALITLALVDCSIGRLLLRSFLEAQDNTNLLELEISIASSEKRLRLLSESLPDKAGIEDGLWRRPSVVGGVLCAIATALFDITRSDCVTVLTSFMPSLIDALCTVASPTNTLMHYGMDVAGDQDSSEQSEFSEQRPYTEKLVVDQTLDQEELDRNASNYAMTPLQILVEKRAYNLIKALLVNGTDPNRTGKFGGTDFVREPIAEEVGEHLSCWHANDACVLLHIRVKSAGIGTEISSIL